MCADLWNALLNICETIDQRRIQRVTWFDAAGTRRRGKVIHAEGWRFTKSGPQIRRADDADGEIRTGLPSEFDLGNWVTVLLAECPEWRALSTWTPRRVARSLSAAFIAFFDRAKAGHGASSGPPRYKSRRRHLSIPHRCASGCRFTKSLRHDRSWTITLKGVAGPIWARGKLPADLNEWMDVDIIYRDGHWEASAAVAIDNRRSGGHQKSVIRLDLIDHFAYVNGEPQTPQDLLRAASIEQDAASRQSACDLKWPPGKRYSDVEWAQRRDEQREIKKLENHARRVRNNALHVWTAGIIRRSCKIVILAPKDIQKQTSSGRGDSHEWGAAVSDKADLNRNVLSFAPAAAIKMLQYKAAEAGIECDLQEIEAHPIAIGTAMVSSAKTIRRISRQISQGESRHGNAP
jgi:hypothetical protein